MKKLKFLVSLSTEDNDYQVEQALAAEEAGRRLHVDTEIIFANNDAINQSQQLLKVIQGDKASHPDAVIFEPVGGTALPHVAAAAVSAGIGWVVLNRQADYFQELRQKARAPVFSISSDHLEIGRIQAQQIATLLPKGGTVVYIEGPSDNSAAKQRTSGMQQRVPSNINFITMKGKWTAESAHRAATSWMRLSTSQKVPVSLLCAQNDAMAMGARRAFQEQADESARLRWLTLPYIGVDGLPKTGQAFVRSGLLTATVIVPPNTTMAMEMLVEAIPRGLQPAPLAFTVPVSFPSIEELTARKTERSRVLASS
ncbi:MAG: sugar ABC transporter substrate-binding protein [Candidatus Acidiferrales bacterium]